jgi:uncharacterized Zn finger protein
VTGGWGTRWIALLASFGWDEGPGRSAHRRRRRLTDLKAGPGGIEARVRLADGESHAVSVAFVPLPFKAFDTAIRAMAGKARYAASLFAGRLPSDVEGAFASTGRTLLPASPAEVRLSCTCRSKEEVCPHLLAVLPLLAERFERDPLLLFELRGLDREDLMARLKRQRSTHGAPGQRGRPARARVLPREPLPDVRPEEFFRPLRPLGPRQPLFAPSESGESVLSRLGPPPFEDGQASELLLELHRAIGLGARERLSEWEWREIGRRPGD